MWLRVCVCAYWICWFLLPDMHGLSVCKYAQWANTHTQRSKADLAIWNCNAIIPPHSARTQIHTMRNALCSNPFLKSCPPIQHEPGLATLFPKKRLFTAGSWIWTESLQSKSPLRVLPSKVILFSWSIRTLADDSDFSHSQSNPKTENLRPNYNILHPWHARSASVCGSVCLCSIVYWGKGPCMLHHSLTGTSDTMCACVRSMEVNFYVHTFLINEMVV